MHIMRSETQNHIQYLRRYIIVLVQIAFWNSFFYSKEKSSSYNIRTYNPTSYLVKANVMLLFEMTHNHARGKRVFYVYS